MEHLIYLTEYKAILTNSSLCYLEFGTSGSYGVEKLKFTRSRDWDDLTVYVAFNAPDRSVTDVLLTGDDVLDVPPEATAIPGVGKIVVTGYKEGVKIITVDLKYKVKKHSNSSGSPSEPTPDIWEQFANSFPTGGTTGQVLTKKSDLDRDVYWADPTGFTYNIGNGLIVEEDTLTLRVNTTNEVQQDNTLPISSAGVFMLAGNIEALLGAI